MNNKAIYKQYDSRWAKLPFPKGYTISGNGCGCCSVTHVIIELSKYKNYTPKDVQPFMIKYATSQGLYHSGIPASLKHYGLSVTEIGESDPMSKAWKNLSSDINRAGVLLFYGKKTVKGKRVNIYGPDGTQWTGSGHFVAFVDYKIKNGKHWFYLKDSSARESTHVNIDGKKVKESHSGWWCYENSMKGCLPKLWIVKIPGGNSEKKSETPASDKKSYSGAYPNVVVKETRTVSAGSKLVKKADTFCWAYGTDKKKWSYGSGVPRDIYKSSLNKYLKKTAKISQSDCGYFVTVCVRSAGLSNTFRTLEWGDKLPQNCKVVHSGKSVPVNVLKPGDIIRYKKKNGAQHTMIFYSNGKIAEAGRKIRFPIIQKDTKKYNASNVVKSSIQVLRFVTTKTVTRSYLHKGDKGAEIQKLQLYLNWYDLTNKLVVDGVFGELTRAAVINFQKENGLGADGTVGEKTLAAMKKVVK